MSMEGGEQSGTPMHDRWGFPLEQYSNFLMNELF